MALSLAISSFPPLGCCLLARKSVQSIDDPLIGPTLHPGPVIRMNGEAPEDVVRWTGPVAGAHTDFVLHTLLGLGAKSA